MSEQIEDRLEIAERVYEKRDGVWWEIDVAGFRALEAMPAFVTQSMLSELAALREEKDALKEAGHGLVIAMKSEMVTCDSPYCKCQTCRAVSVFIAALSKEGTPQEKMVTALRKLK